MSFYKDLCKLNGNDGITVSYADRMMCVYDNYGNKAFMSSTIYQAYCFANLLLADFDYCADDKEVKELHDELLELIEENNRAIDVWNYFDDIHDDFIKLTGIDLGIDVKRDIVSKMAEIDGDGNDLLCVLGSSSLIARKLWNYIKGNDKLNILKCDNELINELADEYLLCDDYDLIKFAEELHKRIKQNKLIKIDGKLVINNVEYEYIDEIEINNGKLNMYWKKGLVGGILIKHIKSINEELNNGVTVALIEYIMEEEL